MGFEEEFKVYAALTLALASTLAVSQAVDGSELFDDDVQEVQNPSPSVVVTPDVSDSIQATETVQQIDTRILLGWKAFQKTCLENPALITLQRKRQRWLDEIDVLSNRCENHIARLTSVVEDDEERAQLQDALRSRSEFGREFVEYGFQEYRRETGPMNTDFTKLRRYFSNIRSLEANISRAQGQLDRVIWRRDEVTWPALQAEVPFNHKSETVGSGLTTLADSGWVEGLIDLDDGSQAVILRCGVYLDQLTGLAPKVIRKQPLLILGSSRVPLSLEVGPAAIPRGTVASVKGLKTVTYKGDSVQFMACYLGSLTKSLTANGDLTASKKLRMKPVEFSLEPPAPSE